MSSTLNHRFIFIAQGQKYPRFIDTSIPSYRKFSHIVTKNNKYMITFKVIIAFKVQKRHFFTYTSKQFSKKLSFVIWHLKLIRILNLFKFKFFIINAVINFVSIDFFRLKF